MKNRTSLGTGIQNIPATIQLSQDNGWSFLRYSILILSLITLQCCNIVCSLNTWIKCNILLSDKTICSISLNTKNMCTLKLWKGTPQLQYYIVLTSITLFIILNTCTAGNRVSVPSEWPWQPHPRVNISMIDKIPE